MPKFDLSQLSREDLDELLVEVMFRLRQLEDEGQETKLKSLTTSQKLRLKETDREYLRQKSS